MTIREIAKMAKVSPAAVSLVINDKKGVSEETRQRVKEIIAEKNYVVPARKRNGRKKKKHLKLCLIKFRTHGITIEENQGFITAIIDQIESECHYCHYDLTMVNCEVSKAAETLRETMELSPDGVILIGTELSENDYTLLDILKVPTVIVDNSMRGVCIDSVVMNNEYIAAEAVQYLHSLGYTDIGYIRFSLAISNCSERYQGYLQEMKRLGLKTEDPICVLPTLSNAYNGIKQLLENGLYKPHGAIIADNDTIAIGAMKAIKEAGFHIPKDVSIIGIDDIPFAAVTMPALTTMRISRSSLGILAVDTLKRRIKNPNWPSMRVRVDGKLMIRDSTRSNS